MRTEVMVYVRTDIIINRPRAAVAAYAADPANATSWYVNIRSVDVLSPPPLRKGSKAEFMAKFMGEELTYTYVVTRFEPERMLVMETADGPFPMQTTYLWESPDTHTTRMTLINQGTPSGFAKWMKPVMSFMMRRANRKDLRALKRILEREAEPASA